MEKGKLEEFVKLLLIEIKYKRVCDFLKLLLIVVTFKEIVTIGKMNHSVIIFNETIRHANLQRTGKFRVKKATFMKSFKIYDIIELSNNVLINFSIFF